MKGEELSERQKKKKERKKKRKKGWRGTVGDKKWRAEG